MECENNVLSHLVAGSHVVQVPMGILPVGRAAALLPTKPPPISERIARDPGRDIRADIEGDKQGSKG